MYGPIAGTVYSSDKPESDLKKLVIMYCKGCGYNDEFTKLREAVAREVPTALIYGVKHS